MDVAVSSLRVEDVKQCHDVSTTHSHLPESIRLQLVDHALQALLLQRIAGDHPIADRLEVIKFAIICAEANMCHSNVLPLTMLNTLLETSTLDDCRHAFEMIEENALHWKKYKNQLLRVCNDLLRRLSRTIDTGMCGRIIVFIARMLPLVERSGLNIIGAFNESNTTAFDEDVGQLAAEEEQATTAKDGEDGEVDEGEHGGGGQPLPVTYSLYKKFWQLQTYFNKQTRALEHFDEFKTNSNDVLSMFDNFKVERGGDDSFSPSLGNESYFAKYLTGQKLLQLQLNDSQFRRYIIVQLLITYQWLSAQSRFTAQFRLNDEQSVWIKLMTDKCYRLLSETQPHGAKLCASIKHLLEREEHWCQWKEQSCPDFTANILDKEAWTLVKRAPKRPYNAMGKCDLGLVELTRLWGQAPNLEACKSTDRRFQTPFVEFFKPMIAEEHHSHTSAEKDRIISDDKFQWRAHRMLLSNLGVKMVGEQNEAQYSKCMTDTKQYIVTALRNSKTTHAFPEISTEFERIAKENAVHAAYLKKGEEARQEEEEKAARAEVEKAKKRKEEEEKAIVEGELRVIDEAGMSDDDDDEGDTMLNGNHIRALSAVLGDKWKTLAKVFNISPAAVKGLNKKGVDSDACDVVLNNWVDSEGARATVTRLRRILERLQFVSIKDKLAAVFEDASLDVVPEEETEAALALAQEE